MRCRSGYGFAFSDRQDILQVLYDNLKDKSKILVGKKLSLVRQQRNGITVVCEDGSSYTGDILAGADGVNSKARSEMWRLADEQDPELVKADKNCKPSSTSMSNVSLTVLQSSRVFLSMSLRNRFILGWLNHR